MDASIGLELVRSVDVRNLAPWNDTCMATVCSCGTSSRLPIETVNAVTQLGWREAWECTPASTWYCEEWGRAFRTRPVATSHDHQVGCSTSRSRVDPNDVLGVRPRVSTVGKTVGSHLDPRLYLGPVVADRLGVHEQPVQLTWKINSRVRPRTGCPGATRPPSGLLWCSSQHSRVGACARPRCVRSDRRGPIALRFGQYFSHMGVAQAIVQRKAA